MKQESRRTMQSDSNRRRWVLWQAVLTSRAPRQFCARLPLRLPPARCALAVPTAIALLLINIIFKPCAHGTLSSSCSRHRLILTAECPPPPPHPFCCCCCCCCCCGRPAGKKGGGFATTPVIQYNLHTTYEFSQGGHNNHNSSSNGRLLVTMRKMTCTFLEYSIASLCNYCSYTCHLCFIVLYNPILAYMPSEP